MAKDVAKTFKSEVGQEFIAMARDKLGIEVIRPVYFGARQVNLKPGTESWKRSDTQYARR